VVDAGTAAASHRSVRHAGAPDRGTSMRAWNQADAFRLAHQRHGLRAIPHGGCHGAEGRMGIIWTIIIGFVAGVIAKFIMPGSNEPSGFILTTILGIVGAVVATYLGQALGWYNPGEGAGLIGAIVGSLILLVLWGMVARRT
jgi:uncharacterized membrane protein YeaQ/YmgE (transglycosylase-associated protein family)